MKKIFTLALACAFAATMSAQTTKYVKVQAEPESWEGTYLIVYELDDENNVANVFNGGLEDLDSKGNFFQATNAYQMINGEDVRTIETAADVDAATFTVTKSVNEGKYNIKSKSGYWFGYDSTDNLEEGDDGTMVIAPDMETSNETPFDLTLGMKADKTNVDVTSGNGFVLRYNDKAGKERFRFHDGNKKAIKFYRQEIVDELGNIITNIKNVNVSENSDAIYNLAGQRVADNYRGVVIKNGKKILK